MNDELKKFFSGIYLWMMAGLGLSALMSYLTLNLEALSFLFASKGLFYGLIGIQLVLAIGIQLIIRKISPKTAGILFFIYSILMGILLAVLFKIFSLGSILTILIISILIYAALAVIGFTTKKDLSSWGPVLFVGMIGIILVSLINIFTQSNLVDMIVSIVAVIVFAGFAVYDQQFYKNLYSEIKDNDEEVDRYTILGALHMYISFVAIFQNLLSLFGNDE